VTEQVEITNVGNNGVASEVTLKLLLAAMEKMAKSSGIDSKSVQDKVVKTRQEELRSIINGTKEQEKNTKSVKENTKEVDTLTKKMSQFTNSVLDGLIKGGGALASSFEGITKELFSSQYSLKDNLSHIPLVGQNLSLFGGYLEDSMHALRSLTATGGTFNNSLLLLRTSAAESHMALGEYTDMIRRNSERLATFGGTVTQGALRTKSLFKELGNTQLELMNMGLSVADINEGLINYQYLTRAGSRAQQRDVHSQSQAAAEYIKQITKLSKLTGQDAASMQEKIAAQQADVAFQMKLAKLRPEEQQKLQQGLAEAMAMAGETGALFFKQQFLGMPPLTRDTQLFAATMQESAAAIKRMQQEAANTGITLQQFNAGSVSRLADFVEGSAKAGSRLEDVLAAASGGLEGPAAELAAIFKQQGKQFSDYLDTNGKFLRDKFEQDVLSAQSELDQTEKINSAMNKLEKAFGDIRSNILSTLIDTGVFDTAAKAIEAFGALINAIFTPERIEILGKFFKSINDALDNFVQGLSSENIMASISTLVSDIGNGIVNLWSDSKVLAAMVVGIGGLFAALKVKKFMSGAMDMFGLGKNSGPNPPPGGGAGGFGNALKGIGGGIAGLGRGIGVGIQATLIGIAKGIKAFADPKVIAGIAVITGSMVAVSVGLVAVSKAIKQFSDVEWDDMYKAGASLAALAIPLGILSPLITMIPPKMLVGAGILAASIVVIGVAVAGATWMIGAALPTFAEGMKSFEELDGDKLIKAGVGIGSVGLALAAFGAGVAVEGIGQFVGGLTGALASLFGPEDPMDKLQRFASYDIDEEKVLSNARALTSMSTALGASGIASTFEGFGAFIEGFIGGIGKLFGKEDPMDKLQRFASYDIDEEKVLSNARMLTAMSTALGSSGTASTFEGFGAFIEGLGGWLGKLFGKEDPMEKLKQFANYNIDSQKVIQNSDALKAFASALSGFSAVSMGELDLPNRFTTNLTNLMSFKGTGEGLTAVATGLKQIAEVAGVQDQLTSFNSSLDFSTVDNYAQSIDNLKQALADLNKELAKSNDSWTSERLSAGELLQEVSVTNKLSGDKIESLNITLLHILDILTQNKEIDTKIERNTRPSGSNIANGTISNLR
jgi:hypothetical protein